MEATVEARLKNLEDMVWRLIERIEKLEGQRGKA